MSDDLCIGPRGGCSQCYHRPCICRETAEERVIRLTPPVSPETEVERLRKAIRAHRDARGDDRCWRDDETLYAVLPEGYTPPSRDTAVDLERCRQFIASRQHPATEYVSPEREIERLRQRLADLRDWFAYGQQQQGMSAVAAPRCSPSVWKEIKQRVDTMLGVDGEGPQPSTLSTDQDLRS